MNMWSPCVATQVNSFHMTECTYVPRRLFKKITLQRKYKHFLFHKLIRFLFLLRREISFFALGLHVLALTSERQLQSATLISALLRGFLEACVMLKEDLFLFPTWELHSTLLITKRRRHIRKIQFRMETNQSRCYMGRILGDPYLWKPSTHSFLFSWHRSYTEDDHDEFTIRYFNIDLTLFTRISDPMRQSEFQTCHKIIFDRIFWHLPIK